MEKLGKQNLTKSLEKVNGLLHAKYDMSEWEKREEGNSILKARA
jgi:hypothetical protein